MSESDSSVTRIAEVWDGADILFANAGIQAFRPLLEMGDVDWHDQIDNDLHTALTRHEDRYGANWRVVPHVGGMVIRDVRDRATETDGSFSLGVACGRERASFVGVGADVARGLTLFASGTGEAASGEHRVAARAGLRARF